MQLHRLRLVAVGPFAEPIEIDFDRLSASGIFLLEGPTGAGKSTLIDAIVFALYGDVAGRSSSSDRIASAVATDGVTPMVELDFSTARGMFRVQRSPKHERRKRRGSGTTVQPASGRLWRLVSPDAASPGEPLSTRLDEIGAEIVDIVGLSREQFVQTVVLPQGEFATFLRADAEQRRSLLQRLFGTEVYEHTVARLVHQRRQALQRRSAAATTVLGAVRAYGGAIAASSDDEETLVALLETDPEQLLVLIQEQLDTLAAQHTAADQAVASRTTRADEARAALQDVRARDRARRRVLELRAVLGELDAAADQIKADDVRIARSRAAARLMPVLVGLDEARLRAELLQQALGEAQRELPDPSVPAEEWEAHERAMNERAAELGALVEVERGLAELTERRNGLAARRVQVEAERVEHDEYVKRLPDEQLQSRDALEHATASAAQLGARRTELAAAQRAVEARGQLDAATDRLAAAKRTCEESRGQVNEAMAAESALRTRFLDGLASQLVSQLRPDQPCPVCGSRAHPAPAPHADADVNRASVDAAAERTASATAEVEASTARLAAVEHEVAELRGVTGSVTSAEALDRVGHAERQVAESERAESQRASLLHAIDEGERALAEHRSALQRSETELARIDTELKTIDATLTDHRARVVAATGGHESVAAHVDALGQQASLWRAATEALAPARAADADVTQRAADVDAALVGSSFGDADEVRAASLDDAALQQLVEVVEARRRRRAECEGELSSPDLAGVDPDEVLDVEAASQQVQLAESELKQAQQRAGQIAQRLSEGQERAHEVQTGLSAQRVVDDDTSAVIRMADLASASTGDNARAMSLPTFVLRERFVDVVASANQRLATMSDGRYRLEHVEDKRGNRKSGLELLIRDAHTEQPRDPATLSGGESFYCSLALALGLADVVTAEAGGVDLGTLFVDEGFGSLDPDTLDQVLEVLQGLATSGRAVGVVSHVPELKEQVAERISVVKNRDGSSHVVVAA